MSPGHVDHAPWVLRSASGLRAVLADGGAPASLGTEAIELVQHAASAFEPGHLQIWVRDRAEGRAWPVLGAGTGSRAGVVAGSLLVTGAPSDADGLHWRVILALHPDELAWAWHVEVGNDSTRSREVDVVLGHDAALVPRGPLRTNELYVSQYLDVTPLSDPAAGTALAVRQNLAQGGRHPWCVLAATSPVTGWATDSLDVHGWAARTADPAPVLAGDLPSRRWQHEHTLLALQTEGRALPPAASLQTSFGGLLLADHPGATSDDDLVQAARARRLAAATAPWSTAPGPVRAGSAAVGASGPTPPAPADPSPDLTRPAPSGGYDRGREVRPRGLTDDELADRWGTERLAVEHDGNGELLSFFTGDGTHVVTAAKERAVLRPHGTILRTGDTFLPDPSGLAVTAWMTGSPASYLTRGHASSGSVLTTVRGYLGLHRAYGTRLFVEVAGRWRLLDLPSAFAMTPDTARWVYAFDDASDDENSGEGRDGRGVVEVRTRVPAEGHAVELTVTMTDGGPRRVLVALHLAADLDASAAPEIGVAPHGNGLTVHLGAGTPWADAGGADLRVRASGPVVVARDGVLFDDRRDRGTAVVTLATEPVADLGLELWVELGGQEQVAEHAAAPSTWWRDLGTLSLARGPEVEALAVSLPWLVRDALVHYLSPRGLEQFTGGAWGTRDVNQGPLELLLALDRLADARTLLLRIFAAQSTDGTWPQAFGFLPGDEHVRHEPAHGDVAHWPVLALGRYLVASGDGDVLDEEVGWYTGPGAARATPASVREHLDRALTSIRATLLPGTHLVAYGHGDWNDSLQPADRAMGRTMTSAWTVTLHHQGLRTLAEGLAVAGREPALAAALRAEAIEVAADLQRHLVVDGELAGYARLDLPDARGRVAVRRLLVHPQDTETGLRHGSLQVVHALGDDLLDPQQARRHIALVDEHLTGVDGIRLFDRPPGYHGGVMRHFQRAETATFVGREIGLMYVHAHLRWCEAMARVGEADRLWLGLRQALAAGAPDVVPGARRRQANTYASSSDAACLDRVDFAARYAEVLTGATGLEGGWRVYSSGPGVLVRLVVQSFLGVRRRAETLHVDPVLPPELDGLTATVPLAGSVLRLQYHVGPRGSGPTALRLDGVDLPVARAVNHYRQGALVVDLAALAPALAPGGPELEVHLP